MNLNWNKRAILAFFVVDDNLLGVAVVNVVIVVVYSIAADVVVDDFLVVVDVDKVVVFMLSTFSKYVQIWNLAYIYKHW